MKVNPNGELQTTPDSRAAKKIAKPDAATPSDFTASAKLTQQLAATPDVRADEVARAKALIADSNYPDDTTIRAVASQIADTIHSIPESDKV